MQTVETDNAVAEPTVEDSNAQDLDAILNEYDEGVKKVEQPATDNRADDRIETLEARLNEYESRDDIKGAIVDIRGDLSSDVFDDDFVEAWLNKQAKTDPRLTQAWINRHNNPAGFKKIMKGLGDNFNKKYGDITKQSVDDRDAVVAAVHGASTTSSAAEETPDFTKMSDEDFFKMQQEI